MAQTNPTGRPATKSIELLHKFKKQKQPFFLATGFIRPHYPNVAPVQYFEHYPFRKMVLPFVPVNDWNDMPASCHFSLKLCQLWNRPIPR
jgi:iduronate 2-sulfatase